MSESSSWKSWIAVILILLFTGLVAAVWPILTSTVGERGSSTPPSSVTPSEFVFEVPALPPLFEGGTTLVLTGGQVMLILAAIVVVFVIVGGIVIGIINLILSRMAVSVEESEEYKAHKAALEAREKEILKQKREGRPAVKQQRNDYSRWSVIATSLTVLMFVYFIGLMINRTFFPEAVIVDENGRIVNTAVIFVGLPLLITLIFLAWKLRPEQIQAINESENAGIPWDFIAVVLTGLLVVGLGVGLLVFFSVPS